MSKFSDKLYDLPDDENIDYVYSHYSNQEFRKLKATIIENFNVDFWHETPKCYHATTHENISDIATKGLVVGSKTRVQSNWGIEYSTVVFYDNIPRQYIHLL